jgi:hypothetical protein
MMNHATRVALFWCAIAAQVAGAHVFFWEALPDYRELFVLWKFMLLAAAIYITQLLSNHIESYCPKVL